MKAPPEQPRAERAVAYEVRRESGLNQLRPFYWVLPLVPLTLYIYSAATQPEQHTPVRFIVLTVLAVAHTGLHFMALLFAKRQEWLIPYFVVQGALAFSLGMMLSSQMYVYALYLALAGQAASLFDEVGSATAVVLACVLLSGVNFVLRMGWGNLPMYFIWVVPMSFFIIVYVTMFIRQTEARREAQSLLRELEVAHHQLAEYAVQVEDLTLSSERERMARELHDTLAQGLAGLILQLEAVDTHLACGQAERAREITGQVMTRARATLADARRAIDDLRQSDAALDMEAMARGEVERFATATGIPSDLDLEVTSKIPEPLAKHVLKILSEGLSNVARHARATSVSVQLEADNDLLEMEIKDDGCGFDARTQGKAGHYGLVGMRERARLAGGTLDIVSEPGRGTTLRLRVPVNQKGDSQ